jgi:hypothetical protein
VGPRAGLDDVETRKFLTLPGLELRPVGRPTRSSSLYRLRYPGSQFIDLQMKNVKERKVMCFPKTACLLHPFIIKEAMFPVRTRFFPVVRVVNCLPLLNYEYLPGCNYDII